MRAKALVFALLFLATAPAALASVPGRASPSQLEPHSITRAAARASKPLAATDPVLLGDSTVESTVDSLPAGTEEAFPFTAATSGTASWINLYVDAQNQATSVVVGLYADRGGRPGLLLASGSPASLDAGAWNPVNVSQTNVVAGTAYWVAVMPLGGALSFRDDPGAGCTSETTWRAALSWVELYWRGSTGTDCNISAEVHGTPIVAGTVPVNTSAPVISGSTVSGDTLSVDTGVWSGSPTAYAYQWQDCDPSSGSCSDIAGATANTYTLTSSDTGEDVDATVTASNEFGSDSQVSAAVGPVTGGVTGTAPVNTSAPVISGSAVGGDTLSVDTGVWSGSPTAYAYQWQDCDPSSGSCSDIAGATANTYTLTSSDTGEDVDATVTASNEFGSDSQVSAAVGPVAAESEGIPAGVTLQPIDGGPDYFGQFANSLPASADFYPITVFDQGLGYSDGSWDSSMLAAYKAVGVNTFINLYDGYDSAFLSAIRADDMYAFDDPVAPSYAGNTIAGYNWFDEADGDNDCGDVPSAAVLGVAVPCLPTSDGRTPPSVISQVNADIHQKDPTRAIYCQYTKPVAEDEGLSDSEAAAYLNANCDIDSYDSYVISDGYASNHDLWRQYDDVEHVRALAGDSRPVWPFIEAGPVFPTDEWSGITATPAMSVAEAWNAIIGGARGIQWFDHDFGGSDGGYATSDDDLIDPNPVFASLQTAVAAFNARVTGLAPILNDPFANGYMTSVSNPHPDSEDHTSANVMVKYDQASNDFYVFAAPTTNSTESLTFTTSGSYSGPVTVQGENRTVTAANGTFTDTFAGQTAVHIYIVPNG